MNEELIKELTEKRDKLKYDFERREKEINKKEKESTQNRLIIIVAVIIIVFTISFTIVDSMTDPGPPYVSIEEQITTMSKLIGTTWKLDESCKEERLEELFFTQINEIYFLEQSIDNDSIICELRHDRGKYYGRVITSKDCLLLTLGENTAYLWFSESKDKAERGVSIKGIRAKMFFI